MKLKISITMDNAAFEEYSGDECARILQELADECAGGDILPEFSRSLRDINGNNVGSAKATR